MKKPEKTNCYYCKRPIEGRHVTLDHVVPVVSGGKTHKDNVVFACKICNTFKGGMSYQTFKQILIWAPIHPLVPLDDPELAKRYHREWARHARTMAFLVGIDYNAKDLKSPQQIEFEAAREVRLATKAAKNPTLLLPKVKTRVKKADRIAYKPYPTKKKTKREEGFIATQYKDEPIQVTRYFKKKTK